MSLETFISDFIGNLGVSFPDLVLLALLFSTIIFWAQDIRYGLLLQFVLFAFLLVWMVSIGANTTKIIIVFFVVLVLMTLSGLISYAKERSTTV